MADTDKLQVSPEGLARRVEVLEKEMADLRELIETVQGQLLARNGVAKSE